MLEDWLVLMLHLMLYRQAFNASQIDLESAFTSHMKGRVRVGRVRVGLGYPTKAHKGSARLQRGHCMQHQRRKHRSPMYFVSGFASRQARSLRDDSCLYIARMKAPPELIVIIGRVSSR